MIVIGGRGMEKLGEKKEGRGGRVIMGRGIAEAREKARGSHQCNGNGNCNCNCKCKCKCKRRRRFGLFI